MEVWKSIPGYEGLYEASSIGNIKSLWRIDALGRIKNEKNLVLLNRGNGYKSVMLYKRNKATTHSVHRIVAYSFKGANHLQVDHLNGDRADNRIENLEYVTPRENISRGFIRAGGSSVYTGVSWHKHKSQWQARIEVGKKVLSLGYFNDEAQAGLAYKNKLQSLQNHL